MTGKYQPPHIVMTDTKRSRTIKATGYESISATLRIRFADGGTYDYLNVSWPVYLAMLDASSMGACHAKAIKPAYTAIKLETETVPKEEESQ